MIFKGKSFWIKLNALYVTKTTKIFQKHKQMGKASVKLSSYVKLGENRLNYIRFKDLIDFSNQSFFAEEICHYIILSVQCVWHSIA